MGSFFSASLDHRGGGRAHAAAHHVERENAKVRKKVTKVQKTYKRVRSALEKVGFKARLLDKMLDVSACDVYGDYSDEDAVNDVWLRWCTCQCVTSPTGPLADVLYACVGLKRSSAMRYAEVFGPVWDFGHTTLFQLVEMIVEYALGRAGPLRSDDASFLLPSSHAFMSPLAKRHRELHNVKVLHANIARTISAATLASHISPLTSKDVHMLYHATNWTGAVNISNDGPLVDFGRPCLDFGKRRSFYLTPTLPTALAWAARNRRRWAGECAIVVFAVKKADFGRLVTIKFDDPSDKWMRLTSDSRRCETVPAKNELDYADVVHGPVVANAEDVARHGATPTTHKDMLWQVAIKSRSAEDVIAGGLAAVVWLRKAA